MEEFFNIFNLPQALNLREVLALAESANCACDLKQGFPAPNY
jgi:hypothetical protein